MWQLLRGLEHRGPESVGRGRACGGCSTARGCVGTHVGACRAWGHAWGAWGHACGVCKEAGDAPIPARCPPSS